MKPFRSLLFVPGHKESWVDKAIASGPDALILDLEDAVPSDGKEEARLTVAESISRVRSQGSNVGLVVRPNAWQTGLTGFDLDRIVVPGLDALLLSKVRDTRDVLRVDALLDHAERRAGVDPGTVKLIVTLETATALNSPEALAEASPRVAGLLGSMAKDGDVATEIGCEWTPEGLETLYMRSRIVLATRAAGLDYPVCGLWQDIKDLDGLRTFSEAHRALGYRGQIVIHPSHVGPVNDVFTPSPAVIERYKKLIAAFEEAERRGEGALLFEGEHIDAAHANRAREAVSFAQKQGVA